jgi:hypothetical protein
MNVDHCKIAMPANNTLSAAWSIYHYPNCCSHIAMVFHLCSEFPAVVFDFVYPQVLLVCVCMEKAHDYCTPEVMGTVLVWYQKPLSITSESQL